MPFFVTCFSEIKDDLSQWRAYGGGENGYAVRFKSENLLGCPNSIVARINYDSALHRKLARKTAEKTLEFFRVGMREAREKEISDWGTQFLDAWNRAISAVASLMKDPAFAAERECRIVKGLGTEDLVGLKFVQKATLMSRHLPLRPGSNPAAEGYKLPIAEVMVGPCRHPEISRISVDTLLRSRGYPSNLVSISTTPLQMT